MKIDTNNLPREFEVGFGETITMKDCAHIELKPYEQVTFTAPSDTEYDVARTAWGYYATPSLNGRLERYNLRGVMVRNRIDQYFILLVESGKETVFERYLDVEGLHLVTWLDTTEALQKLEQGLKDA